MLRSLFRGLMNPPAEKSRVERTAAMIVSEAGKASAPEVAASSPTSGATEQAFDPYHAAATAEANGDLEGAEVILRHHYTANPDDVSAAATLGGFLFNRGRLDEADAVLLPALARLPAAPPLLLNAGRVAQARMQVDMAIAFYRCALAVDPGFAIARYLLALQLLLAGQYPEGFLLIRSRNELDGTPVRDWPRELPLWQGESLAGKRLLIWLDWGGLGDELQFARYIRLVQRQHRPRELLLGCSQANQRLLAMLPGVTLAAAGRTDLDYQVPLFELPVLFRTTVANVPLADGYLRADAGEVARWAERLAPLKGLRIGLCWSSGFWGAQSVLSEKAIRLNLLARLSDLPDAHFISLQKGEARAELPCPGLTVHDFDADLNDMADTAALIENLDVVVSVDTSVAHLAGALGKPVLMMLKWHSGMLWLLNRADSPWYASMRILRQAAAYDWESVARQVDATLRAWPRNQ